MWGVRLSGAGARLGRSRVPPGRALQGAVRLGCGASFPILSRRGVQGRGMWVCPTQGGLTRTRASQGAKELTTVPTHLYPVPALERHAVAHGAPLHGQLTTGALTH